MSSHIERVALNRGIIMPRCACASEVYGSVSVCVCLSCYSCSGINEVQVRVSILDFNYKIMLRSRVMASLA